MISILLLSIALAIDAFAASMSLGAKPHQHTIKLGILTCLYFGIAQGIMPFIGYVLSDKLLNSFIQYLPIIACIILIALGFKMLWEAWQNFKNPILATQPNDTQLIVSHSQLLTIAIATSIDAMGAGIGIKLFGYNPVMVCVIIAIITGILSSLGVFFGKWFGTWLNNKAEVFGGVVLIILGLKILIF